MFALSYVHESLHVAVVAFLVPISLSTYFFQGGACNENRLDRGTNPGRFENVLKMCVVGIKIIASYFNLSNL